MVQRFIFSLILLLTLSAQIEAKSNNTPAKDVISKAIKIQADKLLQDARFSSVSIGVVKNTQSAIEHYGELTKTKGNKPTDNTLYEIASVSKTMTGLMTAYAVTDGKLSLDDNINVYINNAMAQLSTNKKPVTIRGLLTHTSGLPRSYAELGLTNKTLTRDAFLNALNQFERGKNIGRYSYSSAGTELLSFILETVYQMPFDTLLKQVLSAKAGMYNTMVNIDGEQLENFAFGYNEKGEIARAYIEPNVLWGGGGHVKSTMSDLVQYMKLQLQQKNPAITESHKKLFHVAGTDSMAYFWIASDDKKLGTYYILHGGLKGTQNWMMIFPKFNLAVSVITNSSFPQAAGLLRAVGMGIVKDLTI
ncbi:MAG: beta-lactamase family protein [Algicola sp.]|nr:beta-lactamase family protein [Algicola sp.]